MRVHRSNLVLATRVCLHGSALGLLMIRNDDLIARMSCSAQMIAAESALTTTPGAVASLLRGFFRNRAVQYKLLCRSLLNVLTVNINL